MLTKGENNIMKRQNQAGFAVVEAVLIVVVLALLGGVGYWVVSKNKTSPAANQSSVETTKKAEEAKTPTLGVQQSLNSAVDIEDATEDSGAVEVEKQIDSAADSASSVGDSFNENDF